MMSASRISSGVSIMSRRNAPWEVYRSNTDARPSALFFARPK